MTDDPIAAKREQLLESVEREESELKLAVDELTTAAQAQVDLGERMSARAWTWLGGAFLVGLWLGGRHRH
ncbi:MAG: hypothetical protein ACREQJ_16450 [Candidatus Binatia bacterium]